MMADAIAMIHSAGGLAVLAHPGAGGTRERIDRARGAGPRRRRGEAPGPLARRHHAHCARSASSSHSCRVAGAIGTGRLTARASIGMMQVPVEWLTRQDARLVAARACPGRLTMTDLAGASRTRHGRGPARRDERLPIALGAEGMRVAVHYNASSEGARETARLIEDGGWDRGDRRGRPDARLDVRAPDRRDVLEQFGELDSS